MIPEQIEARLDKIENAINDIKEYMADVVLTDEEKEMLEDSVKNEKEGKLVSFEEIENVRNKA